MLNFSWIGQAEEDPTPERLSNTQLLHQNTDYALDMFLIYVLTLSIFPTLIYLLSSWLRSPTRFTAVIYGLGESLLLSFHNSGTCLS